MEKSIILYFTIDWSFCIFNILGFSPRKTQKNEKQTSNVKLLNPVDINDSKLRSISSPICNLLLLAYAGNAPKLSCRKVTTSFFCPRCKIYKKK